MRTGAVILCNDAWSDSRVNAAAVQQMNTRSIVIVPIIEDHLLGLLEAFSRNTNHFDQSHVQQLRPLVDILAKAVKEETANNTGNEPEQSAAATADDTGEAEKPLEHISRMLRNSIDRGRP